MMATFRQHFVYWIRKREILVVTFFAKKHNKTILRVLYPLDYGVPRNCTDGIKRYQFWDPVNKHAICMRRWQIERVTMLEEEFDYSFITWETDWNIPR